MLNRDQASALIQMLEVSTESNWTEAVERLKSQGVDPQHLIEGWKILETLGGMCGTCPCESDFE